MDLEGEGLMETKKAQMNVLVSVEARNLARTCASALSESLNTWVEGAIREKAAKDTESIDLDGLTKELRRVAKKYLPGRVVSRDEMLAMARRVAVDDVEEGFSVERRTVPDPTSKSTITKSRRRR